VRSRTLNGYKGGMKPSDFLMREETL